MKILLLSANHGGIKSTHKISEYVTEREHQQILQTNILIVFFYCYIYLLLRNFLKFFLNFLRNLLKCIIFINRKTAVGSRFFTPDNANDLGMGRQIWKGYYQSARQGCERVLLNINMLSSLFLRAMPVLHYLREITKHNENEGVLSDVNKRRFTREIKSMLGSAFCYVFSYRIQQNLKAAQVVEEI